MNWQKRFWSKVQKTDGCWDWTAAKFWNGYGMFQISTNKKVKAHRLSWELHFGQIPDGLDVLHNCDNPACVNPSHLFLGTQQTNNQDRDAKGRNSHGETHPTTKATVAQVRLVRQMVNDGQTQKAVAEALGLSTSIVHDIVHRKTWKHV